MEKTNIEQKQNEENLNRTLKALIIGATGATGRELTDHLLKSDYYSTVSVIVRRKIDRWENLDENLKKKLIIMTVDDLEVLSKSKEELVELFKDDFKYDTVFCNLGSRTNKGEVEFRKVDYYCVVYSAALCEKFAIPHFSLISTTGANPTSWFMYLKVKGQADEECMNKNIPCVSIFRPGLITDRDNDDRLVEKMFSWVPFIDKVKSVDLALAQMKDDINYHIKKTRKEGNVIFSNKDIIGLKNSKI
jgi:oxidoreductase